MNPLLRVRNVGKVHGSRPVFTGVNLDVALGNRLAVLGGSGSGKTTLLRLLAGLDHPSSGQIDRAANLRISMVFQDLALWPNLTALENVSLALPDSVRSERRRTAEDALRSCRVADLAARRPGTLSIGQQQRVALARAVAARPQILLLDEPFSSLDPLLRQELMGEVARLLDEIRATLVLVTHDPGEAVTLAQQALVLEDGRLVEFGELRALLVEPRSLLLRHFADQFRRCFSLGLFPSPAPTTSSPIP